MAKFALLKPFTKRHIADAYINEWIDAAREGRRPDSDKLEAVIGPMIRPGRRQAPHQGDRRRRAGPDGKKVIKITIPLSEEGATGQTIEDWINGKWGSAAALEMFGDAMIGRLRPIAARPHVLSRRFGADPGENSSLVHSPACCAIGLPPIKRIVVGMLRIL